MHGYRYVILGFDCIFQKTGDVVGEEEEEVVVVGVGQWVEELAPHVSVPVQVRGQGLRRPT